MSTHDGEAQLQCVWFVLLVCFVLTRKATDSVDSAGERGLQKRAGAVHR